MPSVAEQISVIRMGFFSEEYPADATKQILDDGYQQIINWSRVRPALLELKTMSWCNWDNNWEFFLDESRFPSGARLELPAQQAQIFQRIAVQMRAQIEGPLKVLSSAHPQLPDRYVSVRISSAEISEVTQYFGVVEKIAKVAAVDKAFEVHYPHSGSFGFILAAVDASMTALELAVALCKFLNDSKIADKARRYWQKVNRDIPDANFTIESATDSVEQEVKDDYWAEVQKSSTFISDNPGYQNNIEQAAKLMSENSGKIEFGLPPAIVYSLPGGLMTYLNMEDPEKLGITLRALMLPEKERSTD